MPGPWQFIPSDILGEEKLNAQLDEWKQAQRERMVNLWVEKQREVARQQLQQAEDLYEQSNLDRLQQFNQQPDWTAKAEQPLEQRVEEAQARRQKKLAEKWRQTPGPYGEGLLKSPEQKAFEAEEEEKLPPDPNLTAWREQVEKRHTDYTTGQPGVSQSPLSRSALLAKQLDMAAKPLEYYEKGTAILSEASRPRGEGEYRGPRSAEELLAAERLRPEQAPGEKGLRQLAVDPLSATLRPGIITKAPILPTTRLVLEKIAPQAASKLGSVLKGATLIGKNTKELEKLMELARQTGETWLVDDAIRALEELKGTPIIRDISSLQSAIADAEKMGNKTLASDLKAQLEILSREHPIEASRTMPYEPEITPPTVRLRGDPGSDVDTRPLIVPGADITPGGIQRLPTQADIPPTYQGKVPLSAPQRPGPVAIAPVLEGLLRGARNVGGELAGERGAIGETQYTPEQITRANLTGRVSAGQTGSMDVSTMLRLGGMAGGAALGYDPEATPEQNAVRMAGGGIAGGLLTHGALRGHIGLQVDDVAKRLAELESVMREARIRWGLSLNSGDKVAQGKTWEELSELMDERDQLLNAQNSSKVAANTPIPATPASKAKAYTDLAEARLALHRGDIDATIADMEAKMAGMTNPELYGDVERILEELQKMKTTGSPPQPVVAPQGPVITAPSANSSPTAPRLQQVINPAGASALSGVSGAMAGGVLSYDPKLSPEENQKRMLIGGLAGGIAGAAGMAGLARLRRGITGRPITPPNPNAGPSTPAPGGKLVPWFRPTTEIEKTINTSGGWISATGKGLSAGIGPIKSVTRVVDPWSAQQTHLERIPLIFRNLQDTGNNILRSAMANLEAVQLKDFEIKDNRFVSGVSVKPAFTGGIRSLAVSDVLEQSWAYDMPDSLRTFIQTANKISDELVDHVESEGVKFKKRKFGPGSHYFGRIVEEVLDVAKRVQANPQAERVYDTMEAGIQAGVKYEDDLLATAETGFSWLIRRGVTNRMYQVMEPLGLTPKELVNNTAIDNLKVAAAQFATAHTYYGTLKRIKRGMSPYVTKNFGGKVIRSLQGPLVKIGTLLPGHKDRLLEAYKLMKAKGTYKDGLDKLSVLIDEAEILKTQTHAARSTAKTAYSSALNKLSSSEYHAPASKFDPSATGEIGIGRINQPYATGRFFPRDIADYLNKTLKRESHPVIRFGERATDILRTFKAGFDLGTTGIQLLPLLAYKPKPWGKAFYYMHRALLDPQVISTYMAKPDVQEILQKLVPHGLSIEGMEYTRAIERGEILPRFVERLPQPAKWLGEQGLKRAEVVFTGPLNVGKIETARALLPIFDSPKLSAAEREKQLDALAIFLNNLTGTRSSLGTGIGPTQRGIESIFLFFSPRMTRSSIALVGDALQGGKKGREAAYAFAGLAASNLLLAGGLYSLLNDKLPPPEFYDPSSSEFLTVRVFGQRLSLGGPHRALLTLAGRTLKTAQEDPDAFKELRERRDNPLVNWWSGRAAPLTNVLWDLASGRDFMGEPIYDEPVKWAAEQVTPMWLSDAIQRQGETDQSALGYGLSFYGARAQANTPAMERDAVRDRLSRDKYDKSWDELNSAERRELSKNPEVSAAANTADEVYARRGSMYHQYKVAIAKEQELIIAQIKENTSLLESGTISGNEYRNRIQDLERKMAEKSETLRQGVPEWKEAIDKTLKDAKEPQNLVDKFTEEYYAISDKMYNQDTGTMNVEGLIEERNKLRSGYPDEVVKEALGGININRHPEYVKAAEEYNQYMQIPKYKGLSTEQGKLADKVLAAANYAQSLTTKTGKFVDPVSVIKQLYGPDAVRLYNIAKSQPDGSYERWKFKKDHPLIDKYYGKMPVGTAPVDYAVGGVR